MKYASNKTIKTFFVAGMIAVSLPLLAFRGGDGSEGHKEGLHDPMRRFEHMSLMLDLTDEQIAQVKPVIQKQLQNRREARSNAQRHERGSQRHETMKLLDDAIDRGASQSEINLIADNAAEHAGERMRNRILNRAEVMVAIRNVLTEEQKVKLEKLQQLRTRKMTHRMTH